MEVGLNQLNFKLGPRVLAVSAPGGGGGDPDPSFSNVSLLVPADEDFSDASANDHSPTLTNSPVISTMTKMFGAGAGDFTPSGAFVAYGADTTLAMTTVSFTVDGWVYIPTANLGNFQGLITTATNSGNPGFFVSVRDSNRLQFLIGRGQGPFTRIIGDTQLSGNTWYYVRCVYNSANDAMYLFLDGLNDDPAGLGQTERGATNSATNNVCHLGKWYTDLGIDTAQCFLDDWRITKGVARSITEFTPPDAAHPTE